MPEIDQMVLESQARQYQYNPEYEKLLALSPEEFGALPSDVSLRVGHYLENRAAFRKLHDQKRQAEKPKQP